MQTIWPGTDSRLEVALFPLETGNIINESSLDSRIVLSYPIIYPFTSLISPLHQDAHEFYLSLLSALGGLRIFREISSAPQIPPPALLTLEKIPQDGVDVPPKIGSSDPPAGEAGIFGRAISGGLSEGSLREVQVASDDRLLHQQADRAMNESSSLPGVASGGPAITTDVSSDFVKGEGDEEDVCSEGLIEAIFGGLLRSDVTCKVMKCEPGIEDQISGSFMRYRHLSTANL